MLGKAKRSAKKLTKVNRDDVSPRVDIFIYEYMLHGNATRAAINAGYSPDSAKQQGSRLLTNDDVQEILKMEQEILRQRYEATQDKVVATLSAMTFFNFKDTIKRIKTTTGKGKNKTTKIETVFKDISEMDPMTTAALRKVKLGDVTLETYDKRKPAELLGKHIGMWRDTGSGDDQDGRRIVLDRIQKYFSKDRK